MKKTNQNFEAVFTGWLNNIRQNKDILPQTAYSKLRNYLWKGYAFDKNSSGYELTGTDIHLIREMMFRINEIRNFQSHIWHDNTVLIFPQDLAFFIEELHNHAAMSQSLSMKKRNRHLSVGLY